MKCVLLRFVAPMLSFTDSLLPFIGEQSVPSKSESRLFSSISKLLRRSRARQKAPEEPLYFSRLKRLSDDEWRAALTASPANAARWVEAAATYGDVDAQLYWAQMLLDGYGTPRDPERAFRWFSIAAESGRADALNMVGRCHERGWGVAADLGKAAEFYRAAAEKGDNWGRFNLACVFMDRRGTDRDIDAAYALFAKAAEENHVKSFYRVGLFFEHGWGRPRDRAAAAEWYRRSAEGGDFRGQYQYSKLLFAEGLRDRALFWIGRCIEEAPAWFCSEIAPELVDQPDEDLQMAGRRAREKSTA